MPQLRRFMLYAPIVGGVVLALAVLALQIGRLQVVSDFLSGPRTVEAVTDPSNSLVQLAQILLLLGTFSLAVGLVLVSLNAMRTGLLTRMLGYLGVAAGALMVLVPLPIVQIFWLAALGFILMGRWPGGAPPAWRTGQAEPWPVPAAPAAGNIPNGDATGDLAREDRGAGGSPSQAKEAPLASSRRRHRMATEGQTLEQQLEELLDQERFSPPDGFAEQAVVSDAGIYEQAEDYEAFWAERAEALHWDTKWDQVLDWSDPPFAKWFVGGKLNVSYNCLDRHVEAGNGDRVAYHWRGEEGEELDVSYAELHADVQRFANALKSLGVAKGDVVAIYLPMIPEVAVAMLACARIGAIHNVVFGGFSAESVKERIEFSEAKVLITVDGARRKGKTAAIKSSVDEVIGDLVDTIVVVKRAGNDAPMKAGRDHWYGELLDAADASCPAEPMDSEDPLYILYTSGSTAKPKGILHTTGGYLTGVAYTHQAVFDLKPEEDIYWCAADVGWVTGHSYIVYGPLANGATSVMYEGAPDYPGKDIWWELVERYKVTIMYCAPTAIRACMKWGVEHPEAHDLSSLRLLGTVGEPINPKAWLWYWKVIGGGHCPIVDTWWQTETGAIMITTLPALMDTKPGSAGKPLPGIEAAVVDEQGNDAGTEQGYLILKRPWPVDVADPLQGGRPLRRDLLGQVRPRHLRRR